MPTANINISYTLSKNTQATIQIIKPQGQVMYTHKSPLEGFGATTQTIETKPYAKGLYYIKFTDGSIIKQAKIIIQ